MSPIIYFIFIITFTLFLPPSLIILLSKVQIDVRTVVEHIKVWPVQLVQLPHCTNLHLKEDASYEAQTPLLTCVKYLAASCDVSPLLAWVDSRGNCSPASRPMWCRSALELSVLAITWDMIS